MEKNEIDLRKISDWNLTDSEKEKLDSGKYILKTLCDIITPEGIKLKRIGILDTPDLKNVRDFYVPTTVAI